MGVHVARKRRKFSPEFKAEVVELIRTSGRSIGDAAREMDLTATAVRDWVAKSDTADELSGSAEIWTRCRRVARAGVQHRGSVRTFGLPIERPGRPTACSPTPHMRGGLPDPVVRDRSALTGVPESRSSWADCGGEQPAGAC